MSMQVAPGDVLAVLDGNGIFSKLIRFAERLQHKPDTTDHVVIVTHQDAQGRWMGIQGEPGGVGVCEISQFFDGRPVRSNHDQPRPNDADQVQKFLALCAKSLGIPYDWVGIGADALNSLSLDGVAQEVERLIWTWPSAPGRLPNHVVCSSLAAVLYEQVGWTHPDLGQERVCTPADWWAWTDTKAWAR